MNEPNWVWTEAVSEERLRKIKPAHVEKTDTGVRLTFGNNFDREVDAFIRDVTRVVPMAKSEVGARLSALLTKAKEDALEKPKEIIRASIKVEKARVDFPTDDPTIRAELKADRTGYLAALHFILGKIEDL